MVTNPMIANLKLIPGAQPTVSEDSELEPTSLLQRIEVLLRKAFGEDMETIASSLRGF